ncbi:uncharacterized protein EDB93DRAFT_1150795 [Suillus bovinus]|uniref:uncharacterized protein n=1 Tax=Suillus bovinus TaxID=48563 RepID=UPI001B8735A3|nr:uncharacterized protein EDB93DRAFT_1150795 [Suillus bovinus]KAG2145404.1 hypothetical protein EDB93DRAFT_1150795 [Suillus bovinus]
MRFSSATVLAIIAVLVPSISAMPATSVADSAFNPQCYRACWSYDDCVDYATEDCMAGRFLVLHPCESYYCLHDVIMAVDTDARVKFFAYRKWREISGKYRRWCQIWVKLLCTKKSFHMKFSGPQSVLRCASWALADNMSLTSRLKISSSLAAQMSHDIKIATATHSLTINASMVIVVDLNTLYSGATRIEK